MPKEPDYLDCGDDYISCGDDYLDCSDDYISCGDDYLDCGDDTFPTAPEVDPPVLPSSNVEQPEIISAPNAEIPVIRPPYDQGPVRKDIWYMELLGKIIVFFNRLFSFKWL